MEENSSFKHSYKSADKENLSLCVYNTGYQRCGPGYSWGPAARDHYLFHFVTEGKGVLRVGGRDYPVEQGGLFLIRPGELASYTADTRSPWVYYWVGFNGTEARRLMELTAFGGEERLLYPENGEELKRRLVEIYNARGGTPAGEAKMLGGLYLFLGGLMDAPGTGRMTTAKQYVNRAVLFISRNFSREISVEDVAAFVGISPSHLYRVFSSEMQMAPAQFLIRYRVGEAAAMLRGSSLSVGEIAASVGFKDPLYFSRVFKKVKGASPREYAREKALKKEK